MVVKMNKNSKRKLKIDKDQNTYPKKPRRNWKAVAFAMYITFLLLSAIPYMADRTVDANMKDSYDYHLVYRTDGRQSHYYVERVNTSENGIIDLTYKTKSNSLTVDSQNIKIIHIYCRSMYEDECKDVFGIDPSDNSNYYKWYFIEKDHLNVNIDSDSKIEELSFIDTPIPHKVIVNDVEWEEGINYNYTSNYTTAISYVPSGFTNVDIYFKSHTGTPPIAILNVSKTIVPVNQSIEFDASNSYDPDGTISAYIVDFGDGTNKGGMKHTYAFTKPGIYNVILTVIDNDDLIAHAYVNITVVTSSDIPAFQGRVPNQERPEDAPPWPLNLNTFEPIPSSIDVEFYWYLTGENISLYSVTGENGTNDQFIFTPKPDAFGTDLTTLWLRSTEGLALSQPLWINITPVNDPPKLLPLPDLMLHYNDPYTFNYKPYVEDKETPRDELTLEIFDGYEEHYITISNLNATFEYPESMVGEIIYATVTFSDGEDISQDVISIQITTDFVPKLVEKLPDVWLYEGTTKYNVFNLDDYFIDPDNDAIYFSYGFTHLEIVIHNNHSVDISAESEWTGAELVTFRARDPLGAIAEDFILVRVLPVNDPPSIEGVPDFYIRYDFDFWFELSPYINDKDNTSFELMIIVSDPKHIRLDTLNNMVIIMNYPLEFLGQTIPVRITVSDGMASDFQEVKVTITEDFPPELIVPLPDIVFPEDTPLINAFDLDHFFMDVDGDVLYYTTGQKFINISIKNDHSVDLSAPKDWFGTEMIYFRATDPAGAFQQDLVFVTVLPVNDPPEILSIPRQRGNESTRWVLDLEPYIFDVDNNISEMEISVDNDYVLVSGSTLIFFGNPKLPKQVEVTVSDGEFSASQTIDIKLNLRKGPEMLTFWDLLVFLLPFIVLICLIIGIIAGAVHRHRNRFTAEELFLIHQGGTLITHLSRNVQANVDDIIFSGMFTAVQDFIRDTFASDDDQYSDSPDENWALDEMKLGDNNIIIERSENTYLAVIFSGPGSKRLRNIVNVLLNKIETKYTNILPTWDGNINKLEGTQEILSVLIKLPKESEEQSTPIPDHESKPEPPHDVKADIEIPKLTEPIISTKPRIGVPMATAVAVKPPKRKLSSKELLKCTSEQMGSNTPGLAAWPLSKRKRKTKFRVLSNIDLNNLPIALQIRSKSSLPKTIAIKRGTISLDKGKDQSKMVSPANLNISPAAKPAKIQINTGGKNVEIDTTRSLFEQLAEMDD
jgi:PKD repeat protein